MSDPFTPNTPRPRQEHGGEQGLRQAGEDLRSTAREARDAAGEAASTVAAEASAAVQTLKQEGAAVLDTARERAQGLAQEGVRAGAEQAQGIARAIHRAGSELEEENPQLARIVHDAAASVESMARAVRDRSPGEMLRSAEDFARRQPLAFFGVAALAGFALARFARASAEHRPEDYAGGRQGGMRGTAHDTMHDMRTAGTGATGAVSGGAMPTGGSYPHGPATPHDSATGAPGWVADETGTPRPATLASASLGGAVSYRPRGGSENG